MKFIYAFLCLLFLTNCYSYRATSMDHPEVSKKYLITLKDGRKLYAQNLSKENSIYYFTVQGKQNQIEEDQVAQIKSGNFSWFKTVLLVKGVAAVALIFILFKGIQNSGVGGLDF